GSQMTWFGRSDSRTPETFLSPILKSVAFQLKGANLVVDLCELKFMNSATVSPFIEFLKELNKHQVTTRVVYDRNIEWQEINCRCMKIVASKLQSVTVDFR